MGWLSASLVIGFFLVDQAANLGSNIWLSKWSDDVESFNVTSERNLYLGVYASLGIAQGLCYVVFILCILLCQILKQFSSQIFVELWPAMLLRKNVSLESTTVLVKLAMLRAVKILKLPQQ